MGGTGYSNTKGCQAGKNFRMKAIMVVSEEPPHIILQSEQQGMMLSYVYPRRLLIVSMLHQPAAQ